MERLPRYRTGDEDLDAAVEALVDRVGPTDDAALIFEMVSTVLRLARDGADRGELKLVNAALKEMRYSFHVFSSYRASRKASIFGSARTRPDDPLYDQTRRLARGLAERDWMVITGAGPGIMTAGIEGAGPESSFGVSIRLPFETVTSSFLADDPKLINYRYFFTRKLSFVKESHGFVLLPGGFGTLDEAFELLTLVQTGKAMPVPIVLLDVPGDTYWESWRRFVADEVVGRGYLSTGDIDLVCTTGDVETAIDELTGFYSNYQSARFVRDRLVLRMKALPDPGAMDAINVAFADIVVDGRIEPSEPTPAEVADHDALDLARLSLVFDRTRWARLRRLIDVINGRRRPEDCHPVDPGT